MAAERRGIKLQQQQRTAAMRVNQLLSFNDISYQRTFIEIIIESLQPKQAASRVSECAVGIYLRIPPHLSRHRARGL